MGHRGNRFAIAIGTLAVAGAALAAGPVGAQDATSSTTSTTSTTTSIPTTSTYVTTPPSTPAEPPLGPVQPLVLSYDAAAGTIAITNPCAGGGPPDDEQQVTYDLFLVPSSGPRVQLATKQSPYATVDFGQTTTYTIPDSLPYGQVEVLLQCSALPLTIIVERQQFSATIDWQGRAIASAPETPVPAAPVAGTPSFTG